MEIRTEPCNLQITETDCSNCPKCSYKLIKEVREGTYLESECGYCTYSDRPFAMGSSSLQNHYPEGCTCKHGKKQYIYVSCQRCSIPTTKDSFSSKWKDMSMEEKLNKYGIAKLKILAKRKQLVGYSTLKKGDLISSLKEVVSDKDFPIQI
jgi:hypothetical protein